MSTNSSRQMQRRSSKRSRFRAMDSRTLLRLAVRLVRCCARGLRQRLERPSRARPTIGSRAWASRHRAGRKPTCTGSGTLALASLRGKVVYLNFFATWCPPCNEEAPAIDALQRRSTARRGLQVVGVDVLENAAESRRVSARAPPELPGGGRRRHAARPVQRQRPARPRFHRSNAAWYATSSSANFRPRRCARTSPRCCNSRGRVPRP